MRRLIQIIFISILTICEILAQNGTIKGKIQSSDGTPAEYVNVMLVGTNKGSSADVEGNYKISNIKAGSYTIQTSFVGFKTATKKITIADNETLTLDFTIEADANNLQEVVVTAQNAQTYTSKLPSTSLRLNAPLIEIPQNISVTTKQMIKDFGILGTAEMSRMTSGIVRTYGGNNDFSFNIRGTNATNNIFRNGVGGYWWNQQADAFMIERVEFVKGPAGFMIGNAEPSGLLNEVTKQADGQRVRVVEVGYGSWNLMRFGVDIGDKFSKNSRFAYRVVVGGQQTNTFYDFYKASRTFILPSVRYTYKNGSYIQAEMNRMDGHVIADNSGNISFDGKTMLFPLTFNAIDANAIKGIETDDNYIRLSHVQHLGKGWQLKSQVADVQGLYRGDGMYVSQASANYDTLYREYWHINWVNRLRSAQSFVDGKFRTGSKIEHSILAGLDYGRTSVNSGYADYNPDAWGTQFPISVKNPVYNLNRESVSDTTQYPADNWGTEWTALYAQDHIKLYNKVVLTLAGRLSHTKSWASYDSVTVRDIKFTPRLGLTYLINKNMSIYTLYDESFLPQTGRKEDRTNAKPLTGTNIELGFKSQLLNQRLNFNWSIFHTVKNNVLVQNPQTQFYVERGQITSKGFETDVTGNITNNLIINANYTYTDAKITQDADSAMLGFRNYGVAKHAANAMIRYKFLAGKLNGFSFGFGVQYMGDRSAVWAGWTDPKDKEKSMPSFALFDANVAYEIGKFSVRANLFNITNVRAMDSAWWNSATDETPTGYFTFSAAQPINGRIMLNYRF
jgi:iron complex outermembrane recepter protein